jgi:trimeric autotransporter adhesin
VQDVLTVPTSAVHTIASVHTVSVVENGTAKNVVVQVGAVGVDLTEITSGLTAGQQVVIADLDQPLATSSVATRAGFGGVGGAGLGGAGGAAGGGRFVRPGG